MMGGRKKEPDKLEAFKGERVYQQTPYGCELHDWAVGQIVQARKYAGQLRRESNQVKRKCRALARQVLELNQELEAQLRQQLGDEITDESLAILREEKRS